MAFGIGTNAQKTDAGPVRGKQLEVACECWFTSRGEVLPRLIKFMDENGEVQTVKDFRVNYNEEKNYAGVPSVEYGCTMSINHREHDVKLVFFKEECRWVMWR